MQDVAARLTSRVQLTTDNFKVYLNAVDYAFGVDIDFATLEKQYGSFVTNGSAAHRYTPAKITSMKATTITGVLTASTSRPATWSGRISRCGCTCAASRA